MVNYSILDLCGTNLFIKGKFPSYSLSRYNKIFNLLFRISHHMVKCIRKNRFIPFNKNTLMMRDLLYSYVNNTYKQGHIHHDLLLTVVNSDNTKLLSIHKETLKRAILESFIVLNSLLKKKYIPELWC